MTLIEFYSTNYASSMPLPGWIQSIRNGQEHFAPHLLDVFYEDDDMIVLNRPSGLQVPPKGLFQQCTVLKQLHLQSVCCTLGLLHCAKAKKKLAKARLAAYFAEGTTNAGKRSKSQKISKFYQALVTDILGNDEVMITQPIGAFRYPGVAEGLYAACSSGKPAMSKVCGLERVELQNQTLIQTMKITAPLPQILQTREEQ
ncbi:hypothetical protein ABZP36_005909 [Zizania latifolia]